MNDLLDTPWADWLDAFETHLPTDLALVTLEPDLLAHHVDVEAQADSLDELLDFEQALSRSPLVDGIEIIERLPEQDDSPGTDTASGPSTHSAAAELLRMRWRVSLRKEPLHTA